MTPKADDIRELVSGYKVSTADAKRVLMLASDKQEAHELAESIHSVEYGSRRGKGALELLWRMVNRSSRVWRTSRTVIESEVQPR